ncbi:Diguanylate cye [Pseudomonas syringae pv. aceris]|nr:Diguanylate cye [Pseudomonas syringae pv. aceris]
MTVSLGCSTLLPTETADSLLRRADNALYVAKREGRNRIAMAS